MRKVSFDGKALSFSCPGCGVPHVVDTAATRWNGNESSPTLYSPVSVAEGHHSTGPCHCDTGQRCRRCEFTIRAGAIQFLATCTHNLAGQTIRLRDHE